MRIGRVISWLEDAVDDWHAINMVVTIGSHQVEFSAGMWARVDGSVANITIDLESARRAIAKWDDEVRMRQIDSAQRCKQEQP